MKGEPITGVARLTIVVALCACALVAQNPQLATRTNRQFPTVVFTFVLWSADPSYYSFAVDSTGVGTYQSIPNSVDRSGVPYTVEFQISDATRRTTFHIAQQLHFFSGDFGLSLGSPEVRGIKTLIYHDSTFNNQIIYSDATDPEIQELTSAFEQISETLEFGRRLAALHQHDPGGLDAELAEVRSKAEHHLLREFAVIAPAVRSIASDHSLGESVRQKAAEILALMSRANGNLPSPGGSACLLENRMAPAT
jgi:hypothetical protein